MSALLRVSFHFQAEKFQGFTGDESSFGSSASRHWEDLFFFLVGRQCVQCQVMSCTDWGSGPAVHRILILVRS